MKKILTILSALLILTSCAIDTSSDDSSSSESYAGTWRKNKESVVYYQLVLTNDTYSISEVQLSVSTGEVLETYEFERGDVSKKDDVTLTFIKTHEIDEGTNTLAYIPTKYQESIDVEWSVSGSSLLLISTNSILNGTYTK